MQSTGVKKKRESGASGLSEERAPVKAAQTNLIYVELANFKCFQRRSIVGPFDRITGIIGPNGGGKSTVIEAISFCLCKDHVFRSKLFKYGEIANLDGSRSKEPVSVRLTFTLNGEQKSVERLLKHSGDSTFSIDYAKVSREEFLGFLEQNNLLGFTILEQEELQLFTSKSAAELMLLCEKIAGSFGFREQYQAAQKALDLINFEIVEKNDQLKGLKRDKKHSKGLLHSNQNVSKVYEELDGVEQDLLELQLLRFELRLEAEEGELQGLAGEAQSLTTEIDRLGSQVLKKKSEIRAMAKTDNKKELNQALGEAEAELSTLEETLKEKHQNQASIERLLAQKTEELGSLRAKREAFKAEEVRLRDEIEAYQGDIERVKKQKPSLKNKAVLNNETFEDFIKTLQTEEAVLEAQTDQLKNVSKDLEFLERRHAAAAQNLGSLVAKKNAELSSLVAFERQVSISDEKLAALKEQHYVLEKKVTALKNKKIQRSQISIEVASLKQRLKELEAQAASDKQQQGLLAHIGQITEGFYGEFSLLVAPLDRKFGLAVGISLLKILDHLLFENFESAKKAGAVLKSHFVQRNALILENAPFKRTGNQTALNELRALVGARGHLAFDVVQIRHNVPFLKEFLEFFLDGIVICDNIQAASNLKRDLGKKISKIITLDGVVLKDREVSSLGVEDRFPAKLRRFIRDAQGKDKRGAGPAEGEPDRRGGLDEERPRAREQNTGSLLSKAEIERQIAALEDQFNQINDAESGEEKEARELQRKIAATEKDKAAAISSLEFAEGKLKTLDNDMRTLLAEGEVLKQSIAEISESRIRVEQGMQHQEEKIRQLKSDFTDRNKKLIGSLENLEQAILSTRDVEIEVRKLKERLLKAEMDIQRLDIPSVDLQLTVAEDSLRQLQTRANLLAQQTDAVKLDLEAAKVAQQTLSLKKEGQDRSAVSQEEEIKTLMGQIKDYEQKLKQLKAQESTKRKDLESIRLTRKDYLDEQELKGSVLGPELRRRTQTRNRRNRNSQMDVEDTQNDPEQFVYDFSRLFGLLKIESTRDTNVLQISQLIGVRTQKQEELKRRLKELTTSINSQALIEIEQAKIEGISEKLKGLQATLTALFTREKQIKADLNEVSAKRGQRLLSFLNPLALIIPNVYKFVNCDERASANFIIENPLKPFLGGLIYSATPPTKKFSIGTEGLSTGESSLANLAFFLAMNEVKDAPVIFFDEVDAHLDSENVLKFVSAFGKCSAYKQIGFVSHKPFVFKNADVLLGITKDVALNSAACYSFDMKALPKNE